MAPLWADAVMSLKGEPNVVDIRTVGIVGALDLAPRAEGAGKRGFEVIDRAFHDEGLMIRTAGDTIAFSPPLVITESWIEELIGKLRNVIRSVAN